MFFRRPRSFPTLILARSLAMTAVDPIINCLHLLELIPFFTSQTTYTYIAFWLLTKCLYRNFLYHEDSLI